MKTTGFGSWMARQQAVGVGRRRRHDDGQAGDVREQRLEALRVLAPASAPAPIVRTTIAIWRAAGHERQLRRLVEQLVEAHAEEVEVHQLDDGAHAGHRRADAKPTIALSEIGVSRTRSPKRSCRPRHDGTCRRRAPTSMPATTRGVALAAPRRAPRGSRPVAELRHDVPLGRRRRPSRARVDGRPAPRARSTASSSSARTSLRRSSASSLRADAASASSRAEAHERVARLPTRRPPRACGSAAGRPRSGRASGRSSPRRATGPRRRARASTTVAHRGRGRPRRRCRRPRRSRRRSRRRAARAAPRAAGACDGENSA